MQKTPLSVLYDEAVKEEQEFRELLPKTGFIAEYMRYTDRQESPGSFHFWVAVTMLAAIIQRNAFFPKGMYEVYPNLFTVLVAPSGRCRKSRAIDLGLELIQDFPWVNQIADKTSPEALLQALMDTTQSMVNQQTGGTITINMNVVHAGLIEASEFAVFFSNQVYNQDMPGILIKLYDCRPSFKYITRNKKPIILNNPTASLIGGTTPKWLATSLPVEAFEGGFVARILFIVKHVRDRRIPFPTDPLPGEKDRLKRQLMTIYNKFRGKILMEHDARDWFIQWYESPDNDQVELEELSGFIERKADTILKLAMLMTAADNDDVITLQRIKQAKVILEWTQSRMFRAFEHVALTQSGILRRKIIELLKLHNGKISRREILRKLGGRLNSVKELEDIEKMMEESGELIVINTRPPAKNGGKGVGRSHIDYEIGPTALQEDDNE